LASRTADEHAFVGTFEQIKPVYVIERAFINDLATLRTIEIRWFSTYLPLTFGNLLLGAGKDPAVTWDSYAFTSIDVVAVHRIAMLFRAAGWQGCGAMLLTNKPCYSPPIATSDEGPSPSQLPTYNPQIFGRL